ncbi:tripartite tricarboxylate transporter substrate binding protein [soil metagenome]|jgi:tripartite-type tricarboxylate transporter receptor subunit TctC|nr:tripartite tricarboxylate transporter substrate binding protein [Deinococcota bacterium]
MRLFKVFLVVLAVLGFALAQYPERALTYVIPFDPGGESDITARLQQPHLEDMLGVGITVTHRPGGGGAVGWGEFQRSAQADGYQIIGVNTPHIIAQPSLRGDAGYETDGFELISWFHFTPSALIVRQDSPFETLDDLIDFARNNPQVVTVAGTGTFTHNHFQTLRLEREAEIDLTYIPFSGTGALKPAILGGHVSVLMTNSTAGVELGDEVRILAVAAEERVPALPDAPTFRELGYDIVGGAYRGVAAPTGTPPEIIEALADAFGRVNEIIGEQQELQGYVMTDLRGDEAVALIEQIREDYEDILQEAGEQ